MLRTRPPRQIVPTEWGAFFGEQLEEVPLVVILRGVSPDEAVATARAAWDHGVRLVEVTVERPEGLDALAAVVRDGGVRRVVGAGTLTSSARVAAARDAGAGFGVAPGLDRASTRAAVRRRLPLLPGVATATEVTRATSWGYSAVKAFPASLLGPGWVRAMVGPFPQLQVVATGGVRAGDASEYLAAGALGVGVGGTITTDGGLAGLVERLVSRQSGS